MRLKRDTTTIALPRSGTFLTVNARSSIISLVGGILSEHTVNLRISAWGAYFQFRKKWGVRGAYTRVALNRGGALI